MVKKWLDHVKDVVTPMNVLAAGAGAFLLMYLTGGAVQILPNLAGPWVYVDDALAVSLMGLIGVTVYRRVMGKKPKK